MPAGLDRHHSRPAARACRAHCASRSRASVKRTRSPTPSSVEIEGRRGRAQRQEQQRDEAPRAPDRRQSRTTSAGTSATPTNASRHQSPPASPASHDDRARRRKNDSCESEEEEPVRVERREDERGPGRARGRGPCRVRRGRPAPAARSENADAPRPADGPAVRAASPTRYDETEQRRRAPGRAGRTPPDRVVAVTRDAQEPLGPSGRTSRRAIPDRNLRPVGRRRPRASGAQEKGRGGPSRKATRIETSVQHGLRLSGIDRPRSTRASRARASRRCRARARPPARRPAGGLPCPVDDRPPRTPRATRRSGTRRRRRA